MKVSIVTVCLNSSGTIAECLDSIVRQKYSNIESIIIDGGSTDGTLSIVQNYHSVIGYQESVPGLGIYDAMNRGIEMATGDLIGILNSDDLLMDEWAIERVVKGFEMNPDAGIVYGDLVYVDVVNTSRITRYWKAGIATVRKFRMGWMPPHPTFYMKREKFQEVGGYRNDLGTAGDYEFMLRAMVKFGIKAAYIPYVLVKMRRGGVSNGSFTRRFRANLNDRQAWTVNKIRPFFFFSVLKPLRKITQYLMRPK